MYLGKFQGVIAPTTPTGCLIVTNLVDAFGDGITSPQTRVAWKLNKWTNGQMDKWING